MAGVLAAFAMTVPPAIENLDHINQGNRVRKNNQPKSRCHYERAFFSERSNPPNAGISHFGGDCFGKHRLAMT
jgi:hypothetical protein